MVIGGLGYIGSHTTLELLKKGHNVLVVDDLSNAFESTLETIRSLASEYCHANQKSMPVLLLQRLDYNSSWFRHLLARYALNTQDSCASARSRITGVIHFAAFKSVEESIHQPIRYYQNNICGLVNLVDLLQQFGIKNFVFSSSATVFGAKADNGKPLLEQDLVHFPEDFTDDNGLSNVLVPGSLGVTSPYGRTKYFAEAILADVARADTTMRITALRYFNPVGCHPSGLLRENPRQTPTNLFPVIMQVLSGARPRLDIFGTDWDTRDGTALRDYIHVSDLSRGHLAALASACKRSSDQAFRVYNLGTGTGTTVAEVVRSFEMATGSLLPARRIGRRDGDVGSCVAATSRAEQELGWKTELSIDEAAEDAWRALRLGGLAKPGC